MYRTIRGSAALLTLSVCLLVPHSASAADRFAVGQFEHQLEQHWHHQVFSNKTSYEYMDLGERESIMAKGNLSASGLFAELSESARDKQNIEWQWRVDQIHASADLRLKEKEDFAASLFLVFSDSKRLFPSYNILIYAWSSMDVPVGTVIASPNDPDRVRTMILGNRESPLTRWVSENRNFIEDYQQAFGTLPDEPLRTVGIFTDNDNTQEPVKSYYAPITVW